MVDSFGAVEKLIQRNIKEYTKAPVKEPLHFPTVDPKSLTWRRFVELLLMSWLPD